MRQLQISPLIERLMPFGRGGQRARGLPGFFRRVAKVNLACRWRLSGCGDSLGQFTGSIWLNLSPNVLAEGTPLARAGREARQREAFFRGFRFKKATR